MPAFFKPRSLVLYPALLIAAFVFAQGDPGTAQCWQVWHDSQVPDVLMTELHDQYDSDITGLQIADKKLRLAVVTDRQELQTDLLDNLKKGHFIFHTPVNALLDSVAGELYRGNPWLHTRPRVLLSWYPWPNATCRGEGTIVFNLGLIDRLRTTSELAFVVAHEMAHQELDHVNKSIEDVNARLLAAEFRAELRAVLRKEYDRVAELERLFVGFSVNERRHSRLHESAADSLALILVTHSPFDPKGALDVMDVLLACDNERDTVPVDARWALEHPGVDFRDEWTQETAISSLSAVDTRNRALSDSLRTHPDCAVRKAALAAVIGELPDARSFNTTYLVYAKLAEVGLVESAFLVDDAGRAAFLAFQLLRQTPDDPYLNAALARAFAVMYINAGRHTLSDVLAQPSVRRSKSYSRMLQTMHRMRMSDMLALAEHYLEAARGANGTCEETLYAATLVAYARKDTNALDATRGAYTAAFPEGRHTEKLLALDLAPPVAPRKKR